MTRSFTVRAERWALARPFAISRGVKTEAHVVVAEIRDSGVVARGECVPYPRYGETADGVIAELEALSDEVTDGLGREDLQARLKPGAARNALDCALWDLKARLADRRAWEISGTGAPQPTVTAETIGIGTPDEMGDQAKRLAAAPLIKVKLDADSVMERMTAVRHGAPEARLIVDPNEAWTVSLLGDVAPELAALGVEMIEQPVPAGDDGGLRGYESPVPLCADEACHTTDDLPGLTGKYAMINIKLDKTGGLTEALRLAGAAHDAGFKIMVGCMVGTSLAMAPAIVLAPFAEFVDLDGPLLLKEDRSGGLTFEAGKVFPPTPELWG